jgi:hypothetical protein
VGSIVFLKTASLLPSFSFPPTSFFCLSCLTTFRRKMGVQDERSESIGSCTISHVTRSKSGLSACWTLFCRTTTSHATYLHTRTKLGWLVTDLFDAPRSFRHSGHHFRPTNTNLSRRPLASSTSAMLPRRNKLRYAVVLALSTANAQTCYYPNGDPSPNDSPCLSGTGSSGSGACCPVDWQCLDNGLCYLPTYGYYERHSCVDQAWGSDCPQICTYSMSPHSPAVQ